MHVDRREQPRAHSKGGKETGLMNLHPLSLPPLLLHPPIMIRTFVIKQPSQGVGFPAVIAQWAGCEKRDWFPVNGAPPVVLSLLQNGEMKQRVL